MIPEKPVLPKKESLKDAPSFKAIVIGDRKIGKSCLLERLKTKQFSENRLGVVPDRVIYDNFEESVRLYVWD